MRSRPLYYLGLVAPGVVASFLLPFILPLWLALPLAFVIMFVVAALRDWSPL